MDLNRADVSQITDEARQQVLKAHDLDPTTKPFAIGTEAEVYAYTADSVLKIYAGAGRLVYLEILRDFYEMLNTDDTTLTLPKIRAITQHDDFVAVVESRIAGVPLEDKLASLDETQHPQAESLYLDTLFQLRHIKLTEQPKTYLLFDDTQQSATAHQSFNAFYADFLAQKIERVGRYFLLANPDFDTQASHLVEVLRAGTTETLSIVHGDFFPGNVLVSEDLQKAHGVIDYGSFTVFGHYILDIASGIGFYRTYAPDRQQIRERLLTNAIQRLPDGDARTLFQYLLANAILTSDLYAPKPNPTSDGHFQWAQEIVATASYWQRAFA